MIELNKEEDARLEELAKQHGMRWDGDRWVIEDADFHPFMRAIAARDLYSEPPARQAEPMTRDVLMSLGEEVLDACVLMMAREACYCQACLDREVNLPAIVARYAAQPPAAPQAPRQDELTCEDIERLKLALSWEGYSTPEGLESCAARWPSLVRNLISAVLDRKKRHQSASKQNNQPGVG